VGNVQDLPMPLRRRFNECDGVDRVNIPSGNSGFPSGKCGHCDSPLSIGLDSCWR